MSINKNLKKLFICGASLAMIFGLSSNIPNVSAKRHHHHIRTHREVKKPRRHKRATHHKHLTYYSQGYKLGKENLETHLYETVAPTSCDPIIENDLYHNHMNSKFIRGLYKGSHTDAVNNAKNEKDPSEGTSYYKFAKKIIKYNIHIAKIISHQRNSSRRKGMIAALNDNNSGAVEVPHNRSHHNKTYKRGYIYMSNHMGYNAMY